MCDVETLLAQCADSDCRAIFVACQFVAMADGRIWREARALDRIGDALGLSKKHQLRIAREVRKQPKRKCPAPRSNSGKRLMFHFAVEVAAADGRLDDRERKVVRRLGEYLGIATDAIETELEATSSKPEREAPRQRKAFLESRGDKPVDGTAQESLDELLQEVRTPSEEDVYHKLLLHPISGTMASQQFGLRQVGCWATASLMWSLFFGGILALARMRAHRESVLETILTLFVIIGFVMMIPPGVAYWFRNKGQARRRRMGDAEVRVSGTPLAPGSELHVECVQPNRSGKTLHNVSLRLELSRHVADNRSDRSSGSACRPHDDARTHKWPQTWQTNNSFDFPSIDPGDSVRSNCCFSIPEGMPQVTPFWQWWGINVVTKVGRDVEYTETLWVPPRYGAGCGLTVAGIILGAMIGFLSVWLLRGLIVLSRPIPSNSAIMWYVLGMFAGTILGAVAGVRLPKLLSTKVRHHPAMSTFALPGAIVFVICVFVLVSAISKTFLSLPKSDSTLPSQTSKTKSEQTTNAEQAQQRQEQLLKQYQRTILFRPVDEVRQFLISHPEFIERQVDGNGTGRGTALHHCGYLGKPDVARLLLELGADPNARKSRGRTPLHLACGWHRPAVVKLLLEYGADLWAKDAGGLTPRRFAELNKRDRNKQAEILLILDEHLAKLERDGNNSGGTP
ncbi:MAG: ankyrin repeat domain-containing protein [Planctomycetota bacterium]|nr:ankyrin repeat domain-containing protein [Planctomycetota bacterium]